MSQIKQNRRLRYRAYNRLKHFRKGKVRHSSTNHIKIAINILVKSRIIDVANVERVSRYIHIFKIMRHPSIIQLDEVKKVKDTISKQISIFFGYE